MEEDKRVFVSYDGALYFSALETIDQGNYSCSVQSQVSDTGRNGPFFPLRVLPNCKYIILKIFYQLYNFYITLLWIYVSLFMRKKDSRH